MPEAFEWRREVALLRRRWGWPAFCFVFWSVSSLLSCGEMAIGDVWVCSRAAAWDVDVGAVADAGAGADDDDDRFLRMPG